jgi:hypothetical protein
MPFRALLVELDYDEEGRRGAVRAVLEGSAALPTLALAEAAAAQLLLASGPPRVGRHAVVVPVDDVSLVDGSVGTVVDGSVALGADPVTPGDGSVDHGDGVREGGTAAGSDTVVPIGGLPAVVGLVELDELLQPRFLRHGAVLPAPSPAPGPSPAPALEAPPELDPTLERGADATAPVDPGPTWAPALGPPDAPDAVVRFGRRRHGYGLLVATGLIGALAAAGMLVGADDGFLWPPLARVVAGAGIVVALACAAIGARHLMGWHPALELGPDGLVDRTRTAPVRRLPWRSITSIDVSRPDRRRFRRVASWLPDTTYLVLGRDRGRSSVVALGPVAATPRAVAAQVAVHWEAHRSDRPRAAT